MIAAIVNVSIGILVGLLTGYYFDRRSSRSARKHNIELQRDLDALRNSVYSMGGEAAHKVISIATVDLPVQVHRRAQSTQDSEGRVPTAHLVSHFVAQGHGRSHVEAAINELCVSGAARINGRWLEMA